MERRPRAVAAEIIRERASDILPKVVAEAAAGDASSADQAGTRRRLAAYLEARIPPWLVALAAPDEHRQEAIARLLEIDREAGGGIPPVVLLGTIAIGYRVIEDELRSRAADYGLTPDELWAEVDGFRRTVIATRLQSSDQGEVA